LVGATIHSYRAFDQFAQHLAVDVVEAFDAKRQPRGHGPRATTAGLTERRASVCRHMSAGTPLVGRGQLDEPYAMDTHLPRRPALRCTLATLATVTALIAAAPAGAEQSGVVTANFDAVTTTGDWHSGQALGTFTMAGTLGDAGTVRFAYRLFGRRIHATATLIGAKGILTIGVRASMAPVVNDHESAVGRWRTCGGTGPYQHLSAYGDWTAVADVLPGPTGSLPLALHGVYLGRIDPSPALRRAGSLSSRQARC
jgi:hypothetical protein